MNKFFANIGSNLASKISVHPQERIKSVSNSFYFSNITTKEISDYILDLTVFKVKGPDNITISLLGEIRLIILEPLAYIFKVKYKMWNIS